MKKLMILAISAILVANVSAQEAKRECCKHKQLTQQERVEFDIKRLTNELMLSDQQAEKFAATYREYAAKLDELFQKNAPAKMEPGKELTDADLDKLAKQRFEGFKDLASLQEKYYAKFRKDLSARQVAKVLIFNEPFGPQHDAFGPKHCHGIQDGCNHDGKCQGKHDGKCKGHGHGNHDGHKHGPRPQASEAE